MTDVSEPAIVAGWLHVEGNSTAPALIEDISIGTGESHIAGAKTGHLQLAHAIGFTIEIHICRLTIYISFSRHRYTVLPQSTGNTSLQVKVRDNATHTGIGGSILLFGTEPQFATQQPQPFLGSIASREEITLMVSVSTDAVGNDVRIEQVEVGYVIKHFIIMPAITIGSLAPNHR